MTAPLQQPGDARPAAARAGGSSFYLAMRILGRDQREAMFEIYSFCRAVDDIADGDVPGDKMTMLATWRDNIGALYAGQVPPGLEGLAKAARDFDAHAACVAETNAHVKRSFWSFAFKRILGEMRDELRRLDHLTRDQRAMVEKAENGELAFADEAMTWMNPQEPLPLDATIVSGEGEAAQTVVDLLEEPRDAIEELELRDAFCRASETLPERERFLLVKRELEG